MKWERVGDFLSKNENDGMCDVMTLKQVFVVVTHLSRTHTDANSCGSAETCAKCKQRNVIVKSRQIPDDSPSICIGVQRNVEITLVQASLIAKFGNYFHFVAKLWKVHCRRLIWWFTRWLVKIAIVVAFLATRKILWCAWHRRRMRELLIRVIF